MSNRQQCEITHFFAFLPMPTHRLCASSQQKKELLSTKSSFFVYPSRRLGISSVFASISRKNEYLISPFWVVYHQGRFSALVSHHALACILLRLEIYRSRFRMRYNTSSSLDHGSIIVPMNRGVAVSVSMII